MVVLMLRVEIFFTFAARRLLNKGTKLSYKGMIDFLVKVAVSLKNVKETTSGFMHLMARRNNVVFHVLLRKGNYY